MRRLRIPLLVILALVLVLGVSGSAMAASSTPDPYLNGAASSIPGGVQLTSHNEWYSSSSAWYGMYPKLRDFSVEFDFSVTYPGSWFVADGFCFVIQTAGPKALGGNGGNLGYEGWNSAYPSTYSLGTALRSSVAFAFDNYDAHSGRNLRWLRDGISYDWSNMVATGTSLADGSRHVKVVRTGGLLTVTISTGSTINGKYSLSVGSAPFYNAYIGFTGGTGAGSQTTQITNIRISGKLKAVSPTGH